MPIAVMRGGEKEDLLAAFRQAEAFDEKTEYSAAAREYERALALAPRVFGENSPTNAAILNNLAEIYNIMGQYTRAEPLYQRSLTIREASLGSDDVFVAQSLHNLAGLYLAMGKYTLAEPLYQRSIRIREGKLGPDHPFVAASLNNLAIVYKEMAQFSKVEPLYQRSLKIAEANYGPLDCRIAPALSGLGGLYARLGQYAKAEPFLQRSLKIIEAGLGSDHPDTAVALNQLAWLYDSMGQYAQAEPLSLRSLKIRETEFGPDHPAVADSIASLAVMYDNMGQNAQAETLYKRSLKIREATLGPDHPDVAMSLNDLALFYARKNDDDRAAAQTDRMRRNVRKHVASVLPVLNARGQLDFIQRTDEARFHWTLTLGGRRADNAAWAEQSASWLINGKAVVQESLAEQARLARDSQDPRLAGQVKRLSAVRGELAALSQTLPKESKNTAYRSRLAELGDAEQELSRQVNLAAGRQGLDEPWIEAAAVRRALAPAEVLIDMVRFRPYIFEAKPGEKFWQPARYAAWVLPAVGAGDVRVIDLGAADEIEALVAAARQALEQSANELRVDPRKEQAAEQTALAALASLANRVLRPLLPAIGNAKELVVSPDAQLWLVPWAALPVDDGEYAIER